jgi:butyrate kinase
MGTNDFQEVCRMAKNGDHKALLIRNAASYQVGKYIGGLAAALNGQVDAIILTGGMAYQEENISSIRSMVGFIAEVVAYPGEDEMKALAYNGLLALDGKIEIKSYD